MLIDNYQVSWNHSINMVSKSVSEGEQAKRTISQCLITKCLSTPNEEGVNIETYETFTAVFITDLDYQFNRKHAILESFKMAVGQIKERVERTKLWDKFWDLRKKKAPQALLIENKEERLIAFLEVVAKREIKGEFIVYSLKEIEADIHFKR